jgi:glycosyltransferase involved in cell wall biosynthesis
MPIQNSRKLVVVILCETFSPKMGYLQNVLPKYLARLGAEVHLVTTDLPPYYQDTDTGAAFREFVQTPEMKPGVVLALDGYTLHVLGNKQRLGYVRMAGQFRKLREIRPDVVQTMAAIGWIPLDAAVAKLLLGFTLFTGSHMAASCYRPARFGFRSLFDRGLTFVTRSLPGYLVSLLTFKCYAVTADCAEIAWRFFGVPSGKVEVMHLGVDIELFHPPTTETEIASRHALRMKLGFDVTDIVCIYTGKMTEKKNPLLLARVVEQLRSEGAPFRALFIGDGTQADAIRQLAGCTVLPFCPFRELADFYRACDIGVWTGNESISMLDAAACGLPLIISDLVAYREHIEGNGLVFRFGDPISLREQLSVLKDSAMRRMLGEAGARKMAASWSWESRARARLSDYRAACRL